MPLAWIALGSNLDDPRAQVQNALDHLRRAPGLTLERHSSFYRSAPLGPAGQADYCNAVCCVRTAAAPQDLLRILQAIEASMGRDRTAVRWTARIIDLDLLMYDGLVLDSPELVLPHPQLHRRNFVLAPMAELEPTLDVPGRGRVDALLQAVGTNGLAAWPA